MAWDKTLPNNTTKIRNYPTVLTANFAAVEEGQDSLQQWKANFIERNAIPSAPAVTPTRIDDTMQVFSKQNADGETDLYVLDDRSPANTIELTENGRLGGRTTNLSLNQFTFDSGTTNYDENNIINCHGKFNSSGVATYMFGATVARISTGRYRVTFTTPRSDTNYAVVANTDDSGNSRVCKIGNESVNSFDIHVVQKDGDSRDIGCRFMLVGGL